MKNRPSKTLSRAYFNMAILEMNLVSLMLGGYYFFS